MDNLKNSGEELDFNLFVSLIGSYQYKDLKQLKNKITDTQINIKDKDYSIFQKIQHIITQYQEKDINRLNNKISESLNDIIKKEKDNYDNYLIQIIQKIIIDYRDKEGKLQTAEVDFVAETPNGLEYYQVSDTMNEPQTLKRELASLQMIKDNYPKFVLSRDYGTKDYEGIVHVKNFDDTF